MTNGLLEDDLKELKEKRILIVMDDGLGFLGKLIDFDSDTLLLKDIYQAPAKEINWKKIRKIHASVGSEKKKKDRKEKTGYVEWIEVNLERLYLRTDHIVRIWYESGLQEVDEPPTKSTVYSKE